VRFLLLFAGALAGCASTPVQQTRARAAELVTEARVRPGDVELRCDPADAEVEVDGVPRGLCSDFTGERAGLELGKGLHRIAVKKSGYVPYVTSIDPSGVRAVLTIRLIPTGKTEGAGP